MKRNLISLIDGQRETRLLSNPIELRMNEEDEGKSKRVFGYAAKFETESNNLGSSNYQFYETIARGAFDSVLNDDVRALFNHEPDNILARSKNGEGTLRIGVDNVGLFYEFESPDTQAGRDLMVSLERGDIDQSSFSFSVSREDGGQTMMETEENGVTVIRRTINKVSRLYDVAPVTYPAYEDTEVAARSLQSLAQEFHKEEDHQDPIPTENLSIAHRQRALELIDKSAI